MFKSNPKLLELAVFLAGATQLAIAASSVFIPRLLGWREETLRLRPLTRHVFWTYAGYTLVTNAAFGTLAVLAPRALLDGTVLALAVSGFIAAYWSMRVILQLTVYDRSVAATRPLFRVAEALLMTGFIFVALTYAAAALSNAGALR